MGKIIVTEFMTLDGVIQDPGEWSFPYWNDEISAFKSAEEPSTGAHLLGRITYEGFAAAWPKSTEEGAEFFNDLPKYVVSTTLKEASWNNSHIIRENVVDTLTRLKRELPKNLLVAGSRTLVQTLATHNLVDEYHLLVYPLVLGRGMRLFDDGTEATLELVESRQLAGGVMALVYRPAVE